MEEKAFDIFTNMISPTAKTTVPEKLQLVEEWTMKSSNLSWPPVDAICRKTYLAELSDMFLKNGDEGVIRGYVYDDADECTSTVPSYTDYTIFDILKAYCFSHDLGCTAVSRSLMNWRLNVTWT